MPGVMRAPSGKIRRTPDSKIGRSQACCCHVHAGTCFITDDLPFHIRIPNVVYFSTAGVTGISGDFDSKVPGFAGAPCPDASGGIEIKDILNQLFTPPRSNDGNFAFGDPPYRTCAIWSLSSATTPVADCNAAPAFPASREWVWVGAALGYDHTSPIPHYLDVVFSVSINVRSGFQNWVGGWLSAAVPVVSGLCDCVGTFSLSVQNSGHLITGLSTPMAGVTLPGTISITTA